MAKIFYTAEDIEELAARGVTQFEVGPGVSLTDVARETAQMLGVELVHPGAQVKSAASGTPAQAPSKGSPAGAVGAKPRGCQHGPLTQSAAASTPAAQPVSRPDGNHAGTVNKLVSIVSRLTGQGG